jgi:hypothetical protein
MNVAAMITAKDMPASRPVDQNFLITTSLSRPYAAAALAMPSRTPYLT